MIDASDFLARLAETPDDRTTMGVYADWLDEHGRHDEATEFRFMSGTVREVSLHDLNEGDDYDWREVFGEGTGGNTDDKTDACPPGAPVDTRPPKRSDVVKVLAARNGVGDEVNWLGVFKLRDGRYLLADAGCDYTGWD